MSRTGVSLAIRLSGIAINFLALAILARALSPLEFGQYAFAVELIALLCVVAAFGFNMIAIRIIPDRLVEEDSHGLARFIRAGLIASFLGSALFGGLVYFAWGRGWLVEGLDEASILLMVAALLGLTILRFVQETMRAASRMVAAQITEQVIWPALLLVLAIALYLQSGMSGAVQIVLMLQAGTFALGAIMLLALSRRLLGGLPAANVVGSKPAAKAWLAASLPFAFSSALLVFLNRGDILALGVGGSARDVAFYTPASRYAAFMVLGQAAASMAAAAAMRQSWHGGDMAELQKWIGQMAAISVAFSLPFLLLYLAVPGLMLSLFGEEFRVAANALRILAFAQLVNCLTGPIATVVVACEQERSYAKLVAVSAFLIVVLLVILVPQLGMEGAALATLASLSFLNIAMAWHIWRETGLRCWLDLEASTNAISSSTRLIRRFFIRVQG